MIKLLIIFKVYCINFFSSWISLSFILVKQLCIKMHIKEDFCFFVSTGYLWHGCCWETFFVSTGCPGHGCCWKTFFVSTGCLDMVVVEKHSLYLQAAFTWLLLRNILCIYRLPLTCFLLRNIFCIYRLPLTWLLRNIFCI